MKKPHEQEWREDEAPYGNGTRVVVKERNAIIAVFPASEPTSAAKRRPRARLAAAAPNMARALLAHGQVDVRGVWHSRKCIALGRESLCSDECTTDRAALTKAGVFR